MAYKEPEAKGNEESETKRNLQAKESEAKRNPQTEAKLKGVEAEGIDNSRR